MRATPQQTPATADISQPSYDIATTPALVTHKSTLIAVAGSVSLASSPGLLTPTTGGGTRHKPSTPEEKAAHRKKCRRGRLEKQQLQKANVEFMCALLADPEQCDLMDTLKLEFVLQPACVGSARQMGVIFISLLKKART